MTKTLEEQMILLGGKFGKETVMRSSMRFSRLKFLIFFTAVLLSCTVAVAGAKDVPLTLEQRMQKRISISFRDTPIGDVIRVMAEQAGVDIIKSPNVKGNVTATLTNVPLKEALDNILSVHGYVYTPTKNMIRIVSISEVAQRLEILKTKTFKITYADVCQVEKALTKFISSRGSISSNPGTSHIIVEDTESRIKEITDFIDEIDCITPQILVEVRIYDITSQDKLDLGIEWEAGRNTTFNGGVGNNPTAGARTPFVVGGFSAPTSKTADTTTGALRFGWLSAGIDLDMILRAQHEDINAKLLANPRILVLDNETALFDIVTEHPYVERTISGDTITETVKFKPVGIKLNVTPHVTRAGMVRLRVAPEFGVKVGEVTGLSITVPIVDLRKVDTIALVQDGQTVVLGGLRKKEVSQQTNKIPLFGDLPLIGALFRFEGEDTTNSEIVVFITPKIIKRHVMSQTEKQAYEDTEFPGPQPAATRAEKRQE